MSGKREPGASEVALGHELIDQRIRELGDWRGSVLKRMRELIHEAEPDVIEEWKWVKETSPGTPVWSHKGGICTGESYKQAVKLTFFHGAALSDPARLFNASLEGKTRRAIRHSRRRRDRRSRVQRADPRRRRLERCETEEVRARSRTQQGCY